MGTELLFLPRPTHLTELTKRPIRSVLFPRGLQMMGENMMKKTIFCLGVFLGGLVGAQSAQASQSVKYLCGVEIAGPMKLDGNNFRKQGDTLVRNLGLGLFFSEEKSFGFFSTRKIVSESLEIHLCPLATLEDFVGVSAPKCQNQGWKDVSIILEKSLLPIHQVRPGKPSVENASAEGGTITWSIWIDTSSIPYPEDPIQKSYKFEMRIPYSVLDDVIVFDSVIEVIPTTTDRGVNPVVGDPIECENA